jgi:hypothetical protein
MRSEETESGVEPSLSSRTKRSVPQVLAFRYPGRRRRRGPLLEASVVAERSNEVVGPTEGRVHPDDRRGVDEVGETRVLRVVAEGGLDEATSNTQDDHAGARGGAREVDTHHPGKSSRHDARI